VNNNVFFFVLFFARLHIISSSSSSAAAFTSLPKEIDFQKSDWLRVTPSFSRKKKKLPTSRFHRFTLEAQRRSFFLSFCSFSVSRARVRTMKFTKFLLLGLLIGLFAGFSVPSSA